MPQSLPVIEVKPGGGKRLAQGLPWVYSNEIVMTADAKALPRGSLVRLAGASGGIAMFNPHTLIAARRLTADPDEPVGADFFRARIEAALRLRKRFFEAPFYRLVHAEGDGLPGLVVDRYGDVLAVQANTAGMDRLTPDLLAALKEVLGPKAVVLRNDAPARETEGLERKVEVAFGEVPETVEIVENGVTYLTDVRAGQKTGWFYDHRGTRALMAGLAKGASVLDLYCHTGGFALACAAAGAARVSGVDRSAPCIALAERSAKLGGLEATFRKADVFAALEHFAKVGTRFDVVIADPPAFVKSRKDLQPGLKGYAKLAKLAAGAVAPNGLLFIASCSHLVDLPALTTQVAKGIGESGRTARILHTAGAGPDHPAHLHLPETAYLKALVLELD